MTFLLILPKNRLNYRAAWEAKLQSFPEKDLEYLHQKGNRQRYAKNQQPIGKSQGYGIQSFIQKRHINSGENKQKTIDHAQKKILILEKIISSDNRVFKVFESKDID